MSEHEPIPETATLKDQVQQSRRETAGPVVELYRSQISRSAEIDWREDDDHQERLYLRVLAALGESLSVDEEPLKLFAGAFDLLLVTSDRILWVEAKPRLGRAHAPKSVIAIDRFACQSKVKRGMVTSTLTLSAPGAAKVTFKAPHSDVAEIVNMLVPDVEAEAATTANSLTDELQSLADMHTKGLLSDSEFSSAKARLLDS